MGAWLIRLGGKPLSWWHLSGVDRIRRIAWRMPHKEGHKGGLSPHFLPSPVFGCGVVLLLKCSIFGQYRSLAGGNEKIRSLPAIAKRTYGTLFLGILCTSQLGWIGLIQQDMSYASPSIIFRDSMECLSWLFASIPRLAVMAAYLLLVCLLGCFVLLIIFMLIERGLGSRQQPNHLRPRSSSLSLLEAFGSGWSLFLVYGLLLLMEQLEAIHEVLLVVTFMLAMFRMPRKLTGGCWLVFGGLAGLETALYVHETGVAFSSVNLTASLFIEAVVLGVGLLVAYLKGAKKHRIIRLMSKGFRTKKSQQPQQHLVIQGQSHVSAELPLLHTCLSQFYHRYPALDKAGLTLYNAARVENVGWNVDEIHSLLYKVYRFLHPRHTEGGYKCLYVQDTMLAYPGNQASFPAVAFLFNTGEKPAIAPSYMHAQGMASHLMGNRELREIQAVVDQYGGHIDLNQAPKEALVVLPVHFDQLRSEVATYDAKPDGNLVG